MASADSEEVEEFLTNLLTNFGTNSETLIAPLRGAAELSSVWSWNFISPSCITRGLNPQ